MFHHLPGIFPASNRKQSSPTLAETLAQRQNLTTWMVLREVLVKGLDQWSMGNMSPQYTWLSNISIGEITHLVPDDPNFPRTSVCTTFDDG